MKIIEIQHLDCNGLIIWQDKNIHNLLHLEGELYLLQAAFAGGQDSTVIPVSYYLGLDNRSVVNDDDTMDELIGEPLSGGYARAAVASSGDFAINLETDHYLATSPVVQFQATTGWGPISKLFLTTNSDNSGKLISTAELDSPLTLGASEKVTMRIGMTLKDCP